MRVLALGVSLMLAACSSALDADTEPTTSNTMRSGSDSVTMVQASALNRLSDPKYLPAWGPQYPGAEVREKLVQRRDDAVIGRATTFVTDDPMDEVVAFYRRAIDTSGIEKAGPEASWTNNWSQAVVGEATGYNNHVIVRRANDVGTERTHVQVIAATTR